ncbi:hypothetical protein T07_7306 [Trichinella nelsoni]|uniref:Uncharacterized protein n=1 Tax=Trichinella nelsoni TaxID=6336 RepID=A0A0V0RDQ4_9BILA|nr:hypothetical protein T07_7306 [Trichinella nelsoni]
MTQFGSEMEVRGSEEGKEVFSVKKFAYEKAGKVCCENRCKTGKPWNESAFVANTAKLYLLIRLTFLLS